MANVVYCNAGPHGTNEVGVIGPLVQGQAGQTLTISLKGLDGVAVDVTTGFTETGTITVLSTNTTTAITGTLTGGNGSFTWLLADEDTGTAGKFLVHFQFDNGSITYITLPLRLLVYANPAVTAVAGAAVVGVPSGDAAWLAAANAVDATTNNIAVWDASDQLADGGATVASLVPLSLVDAKGDLLVGTAADTLARLAVGTNAQVLTADSAEAGGVKWATVAGTGDMLAANNLSDVANVVTARANLGVEIGVDVQAYDAELAAIAALTPTDNNIIVGNGTTWVAESDAVARSSLGLGTGNNPQFAGINVGAVADTTVNRASAGDIAVEGNIVYRAGGTDVPVTDGGTGASTAADARTNLDVPPIDSGIVAVSAGRDLTGTDAFKILECDGTFTLTCPNGLDTGFQCAFTNVGTGVITFAATTTLQSAGAAVTLDTQYAMATVYHRGSNVWLLAGNIA